MAILAFDCCLKSISVAVLRDGGAIVRTERADNGGQAERVLPLIEATLADAGMAWGDLTLVAVTLGPGGFTSVRVGIAVARGLELALGIPAVGQSSLEALAATAVAEPLPAAVDRVVAVVSAGKGGIYWQAFTPRGGADGPPRLVDAKALATLALTPTDMLIGPGVADLIAARGPAAPATVHTRSDLTPDAAILAGMAKHLTQGGELRPIYLRAADAQPQVGKALARA